jgi:hypothetical protein
MIGKRFFTPVMPDVIRHPASRRAVTKVSGTPDQVRGDHENKNAELRKK